MAVEFLPVFVGKQKYFAVNILKIVDALSKPKSEFRTYSNGMIADVTKYVFKPGALDGEHIFKLPKTKYGEVLVSDRFCKLIAETKLKGLRAVPVPS